MNKQRQHINLSRIMVFVLSVAMLAGFCPEGISIADIPITLPKVQAASSISNPRIVKDSSMKAGQKVTWDCIWFGSYPQSEITSKDGEIYNILNNATGWDSNNDITIGGTKYRRLKGEDAILATSGSDSFYNWNHSYKTYHYFKYEPIKWRVLNRNGNDALLLADVALDDQQYNTNVADVTWQTSSMRSWLNGYGASANQPKTDYSSKNFINTAFTSTQRNAISVTNVVNANNISYGTAGGNNTSDKIFLLSESEVYNTDTAAKYGFVKDAGTYDEARRSRCSTYAYAMGTWRYEYEDDNPKYNGNIWWWLRSPGCHSDDVAGVDFKGWVSWIGYYVYNSGGGVRPALHLNLASSNLYSYAGTVCSDAMKSGESGSDNLVSNRIKYDTKDTYSFGNKGERVDLKILKKFFKPALAYRFYLSGAGEGGLCYGMAVSAMSSSIYSSPECTTYNRNQLFDVRESDRSTSTHLSAIDYVKYAYISQLTEEGQRVRQKGKKDLDGLYKAVVDNVVNGGEPVALSIRGNENNEGHALWVTGIGDNNENMTEIMVYDCNWPGQQRPVVLKKKNGKYVSWEYTLWEGETWGTGRVNAALMYNDPASSFVKQFGKTVGYTPIISGQSKFLISVDNTNSKIVNKDNTWLTLSPDVNDNALCYIEKDNILPGSDTADTNYSFWSNIGNEVKFTAGLEQTECSFTSEESSIDLSVPQNTEADVSVQSKDNNDVTLSMSTRDKYKVAYNAINQKDGMNQIIISGQNAAQFNGEQTKEGVLVESDSLKNMEIELMEINEEGEDKKLASSDISTNSNKILISNNTKEEKLIIKEDSDGDGEVDKNIISLEYGKKDSDLKKDTDTQPARNINISSIRLSGISKQIAAGRKLILKPTILPANASNRKLIWKSGNPKVATVTQSGVVTLKKKTGGKKVIITATAADGSGTSATWKITSMNGIVKKIKITGTKSVKAGKKLKLKAKVTATKKANTKLLWTSSNTKYATVNAKGIVTTKKTAKGKTVKITAMATDGSGKKQSVKIKITK